MSKSQRYRIGSAKAGVWFCRDCKVPTTESGPCLCNGSANAPSQASEILTTAAKLVSGDRDRAHGEKHRNFANIAAMWSAYLAIRSEPASPLTAADVGHMLAIMKLARTQSGAFNVDDYTDCAGYAACAGEIAAKAAAG